MGHSEYRIWINKIEKYADSAIMSMDGGIMSNYAGIQYVNVNTEHYSGIRDSIGTPIFEGDKVKDQFGFIKIVDYDKGAFVLNDHDVYYWLHEYAQFDNLGRATNLEVVGTIHDKE
jgi:hypothetical protein